VFYGFNTGYFIYALPALILALVAQAWVNSAYRKYQRVANHAGINGVEAARRMMADVGAQLRVEGTRGTLSDHYDPRENVLRLSPGVAQQPSVASLAIVAHELGHAQQDASAFALLKVRSGLVPMVNLTSWLGPILFMAGIFLGIYDLAWVGVICFAGAAVFSLVTLPVELDASRRGMAMLKRNGLLQTEEERRGARNVLTAAAMTYVAALAQSLSTLFYYGSILGGGRRRRS
jgi:Zn-dependent membrane protease YugP